MTGICCARAAATSGLSFFDGGGGYDDIRAADVFGGVAGVDAHAQGGQVLSYRALRLVGSGDDVALVVQHFGDAAHARAADADEMDVSDSVFHGGVLILRFQTASAAHRGRLKRCVRKRADCNAMLRLCHASAG